MNLGILASSISNVGGVTPPVGNWGLIEDGTYDSVSLDVNPPEGTPWDLVFSDDGTKLYVTGNTGDKCRQYSGTAWDLSTFVDDSKEYSFTTQTTQPFAVRWKSDGTKCYAVGRNNSTLFQYSASTAWDISTLSYDSKSLVVTAVASTFNNCFFSPDGLILLTVSSDDVYYYDLSSAWDISTAVSDSLKDGLTNGNNISGMFFNSNGRQLYIAETPNTLNQYDLSVAWDASTIPLVAASVLDVSSEETALRGIAFKSDGTKFYIVGNTSDFVHQYSL